MRSTNSHADADRINVHKPQHPLFDPCRADHKTPSALTGLPEPKANFAPPQSNQQKLASFRRKPLGPRPLASPPGPGLTDGPQKLASFRPAHFREPFAPRYHRISQMIALSAVSKHFNGKRQVVALDAIDLHIERGEMVSIMGPSGSGKSTLLNLIGGLDRPTSGEIRIDGQSIAALSDDDLTRLRRDKIGFIFQFFNLLPRSPASKTSPSRCT